MWFTFVHVLSDQCERSVLSVLIKSSSHLAKNIIKLKCKEDVASNKKATILCFFFLLCSCDYANIIIISWEIHLDFLNQASSCVDFIQTE